MCQWTAILLVHCPSWWLVPYSVPSHYLKQSRSVVIWTAWNKESLIQNVKLCNLKTFGNVACIIMTRNVIHSDQRFMAYMHVICLRDWSRLGGSYGNNTRMICCPAPRRPESTALRRTTNHEVVVAVTPDRLWSIPIITWLNNVVDSPLHIVALAQTYNDTKQFQLTIYFYKNITQSVG